MRYFYLLILSVPLFGCSTSLTRSQWSDKNMRIMIDPDSLSVSDYVAVQTAIVKENKFMVIDRNQGFRAVKYEQERLHKNEVDRFSDKEKWAHWGKMYGVGAIVTGHIQCAKVRPLLSLSPTGLVNKCKQFLSLIDANTAEVIVAVDGLEELSVTGNNWGGESFSEVISWDKIVSAFVDAYPRDFKAQRYSDGLLKYQELSKEEAQRMREGDVRSLSNVDRAQGR